MRYLNRAFLFSILSLWLFSLVGCGAEHREFADPASLEAIALEPGKKLRVIATTNIVGNVVHNVGGDRIELTVLMGSGVDPHSYVTAPADVAQVHDAHVLFINGAGLEAGIEEMLDSAGGDAVVISLSNGLELRPLAGPGHADEEHDDGHGEFDPHVWFDVQQVMRWVDTISATLSALDPEGAADYGSRTTAYTATLADLDAWVAQELATIPEENRLLVTNHPVFGYLAARYGLEQVGAIYPVNPSAEPSAQDIAALEDFIRQQGVPAIFAESTVNPKLAQQIADDTGVELIALYTGSLGEPGSGAETYVDLIRYDVSRIVEALR